MGRPHGVSISMSRAKRGAERKRRGKGRLVLGAAGLSLTLASGASATTEAPVADALAHNGGVSHEITLSEEEISDVSLATFCVFDKENAGAFRPGVRLAMGAGGCGRLRRLRLLDGHLLHVAGVRERCLSATSSGQAGTQARS